jgi:radical SAM protein (TIGR04043 family)
VAETALRMPDLDERQLLVELQSLGVRVQDDTAPAGPRPGRRGGAGPSDALFMWVRGLPLTVPWQASFVDRSPYMVHVTDAGSTLYRDGDVVAPVKLPRRPRIYDMHTADGIPYWKIALLHLDSIASTVVQKCIYWGTEEQCGFCGIELTRGEQTIPVKTPAQLAEVCTAARDLDGAVDVTLTTGSINRRDRGALYISRCAAAIKEACGLPIQVQFEPPDDLAVLSQVRDAGVDAVGIHIETFDPLVLGRVAAGKAKCGVEGYFRCWERAVEVFGRGRVSTYVILGMGERRELIEEGCARAIELGVYPFVVPLRPVPGTLMQDTPAPDADYVASVYRSVSAMLAQSGLDHAAAKAGCARCQACSGLSAWERVFKREEARAGGELVRI